jgi:uncharacterized protein (DUF433 family)
MMMISPPIGVDVPLRTDEGGVIRVGQTRVTLQTLIVDFNQGASPEEIVHHYPALTLSDVYLVIGYYLQHRDEVDTYVKQQRSLAEQARREYEAATPDDPLRARLLALSQQKKA